MRNITVDGRRTNVFLVDGDSVIDDIKALKPDGIYASRYDLDGVRDNFNYHIFGCWYRGDEFELQSDVIGKLIKMGIVFHPLV